MTYFVWFVLGIVLSIPLILFANKCKGRKLLHLLGTSLVVAAIIYIGFSIAWGNAAWLGVELLGVSIYSFFYWLANRYSILWLAVGWIAHPLWDIAIHLKGAGAHIVPEWYAIACVSFDILIAIYICYRWNRSRSQS